MWLLFEFYLSTDIDNIIMTIIGSVAFGSMGYEAHISKNKSKFVIALFFLLFMGYYFYKFLMIGL